MCLYSGRTITALAAAQALKERGYSVTIHEEKGKIKIPALKEGSGGESITIIADSDGSLSTGFGGFKGKKCFEEADKPAQKLKYLGVEIKVEDIKITEEGTETEPVEVKNELRDSNI
ncbi:MAG: hypothetical protein QW728_03155 [Thermoplasmata archaeon]